MKRVAVLGPSAERYKGGIAQFTSRLVEELAKHAEMRFISWKQMYPSFLIGREFVDEVSRSAVSSARAEFLLAYMNPLTWLKLVSELRGFAPDLVIFTWSHAVHAPVYLSLQLMLGGGNRVRFICHNVLPHEGFPGARLLTRLCFSRAGSLVVHGSSEEQQVRALLGRPVSVTRLFLPLHNFFGNRVPKRSDGRTMLYFGNIRAYKGLDVLLRAMPLILGEIPDAKLVIAGEMFYAEHRSSADERENPLLLVEKLGIAAAVEQDVRYIPNEEIPPLMARADVCVFPFRSATQSGALTVAYAYGVPVVTTRVGGIPDVVVEGQSGMLVEAESPPDLARCLIEFFRNPIPPESVDEFAKRLSWQRYAEALVENVSCADR